MEDIKLKCSFCGKKKSWEEFHYVQNIKGVKT